MLVAGSAGGVLGIIVEVAVVVMRGRGSAGGKDFSDQLWTESAASPAVMAQPGVVGAPAQATMMQQPMVNSPFSPWSNNLFSSPFQPAVQQPAMSASGSTCHGHSTTATPLNQRRWPTTRDSHRAAPTTNPPARRCTFEPTVFDGK